MAKVPKQLYIVAKDQSGGYPLGFMHSYEPGKDAFIKKQKTQHEWAYKEGINDLKFEELNSILYRSGFRYKAGTGTGWCEYTKESICEPVPSQPMIWDNEPRTGFKILTSVSRYSTSNKLWRVLDPRGIQFEISTASFEELVMLCTIVKGEILEPCQWLSTKTLKAVIQ